MHLKRKESEIWKIFGNWSVYERKRKKERIIGNNGKLVNLETEILAIHRFSFFMAAHALKIIAGD